MSAERLATGVRALDQLLGGGLDLDAVTEVYGEGGTGKTILCLQLAIRVALSGSWVFYVDSEGVSVDKLEAMAGERLRDALERLLISSPQTQTEQARAVRNAARIARGRSRPVGLIVVDSATYFYRLALGGRREERARETLGFMVAELVAAAIRTPVPVIATNQVWRNVTEGTLEPLGGAFLNHAAKAILRFDRVRDDRRRATLVKHRSLPEGSAEFRITTRGLE